MLKMVLATARDRARLKEITSVLIRYGLQDVLRLLGLGPCYAAPAAEPPRRMHKPCLSGCVKRSRRWAPPSSPGQILATRSDLLDPAWTDELDRLHSQAAVLPWETLAPQIIADLGGEPEQRFAEFDRTPLAAASMAQSTARACTAANR